MHIDDDLFIDPQIIKVTQIGAPTECWWIILDDQNCPIACAENILIFSTDAWAEEFVHHNINPDIDCCLCRIPWQNLVDDYRDICNQVALDWKGPGEGWHKNGGRYRLI